MSAIATIPLDFSRRATTPELMDTEDCGFEEFRACLVDLAQVNRVTLAYRPTFAWLERAALRRPTTGPLHILDVGSGYGDMLRRIDRWAQRRGTPVILTGIDLNPWSRQAAEQATPAGRPIHWVTTDLFDYRPDAPIDVVISSLFTHHLSDGQVVRFLRWMEATASRGWFINDLHRHPLPYHVFRHGARLAGWHRFVRHDGPVSITRAFVPEEWRRLVDRAGLAPGSVTIERYFPFRLCVGRLK
jgi:SAM-dependent methyltransferase